MPHQTRISGQYPIISSMGISGLHSEAKLTGPGVVTGRYGTIGQVFYSEEPYWPLNTTLYVSDFKGNHPKFSYYLLKNMNLETYSDKSAVPGINRNHVHEETILIPERFGEQENIAEILSSFDDKIQLLQQQNKTLDGMASALFHHHILESEVWVERPLDEVATFLNGLALQKFPPNGGKTLNAIKIRELNQGITENTEVCGDHLPDKYIVDSGDILFSWSGSLQIVLWAHGRGALNQHLFKVYSDHYPKWFIYLATKHHLPEFRQIAESKATTMGHIQRQHLTEAMIPCPPIETLQELNKIFDPLLAKIIDNNAQILILIKTRDNILPKLMSGEVRLA